MSSHKQPGTIEHWLCIKGELTKASDGKCEGLTAVGIASDGKGLDVPQCWVSARVGCEQEYNKYNK